MESLTRGELTIEGRHAAPGLIRLDWRGRSAFRHPDEILTPFLGGVLEQAKQDSASIEMHFELLDYLNSSTVAVLVQFLQRARAEGISLCFTYAPTVRWQQLSFEALRVFEQLDKLIHVVPLRGDSAAAEG